VTAENTAATPVEKVFIADLLPDSKVVSYFVCSAKEIAVTRDGREFLRLALRDASGEVKAVHFDPTDEALEDLAAGDVVKIVGQYAESPQYGPQLKVQQLYILAEGSYDPATLVAISPVPLDELTARLNDLVESVGHADLRWLLLRSLDPAQEPGATYRIAPAAVRNHHAYLYGLLEHSLVVAEVAATVADRMPQLDRDLVVAGGLLHDMGKTVAYSVDPFRPGLTDKGRLHGEIAIGHAMLLDLMRERPGFPDETATRLLHVVISHHGEREKGSPAVPMTREAVVVHYCDDMTARVAAFDEAERATPPSERWTAYSRMLDTPLYVGEAPASGPESTAGRTQAAAEARAAGTPAPAVGADDWPAAEEEATASDAAETELPPTPERGGHHGGSGAPAPSLFD
jgi:3'-5' exoribonuclease